MKVYVDDINIHVWREEQRVARGHNEVIWEVTIPLGKGGKWGKSKMIASCSKKRGK